MVDGNYIATHLRGAWLTMLGRREGLALLDLSEDGFWKSLQAVIVALPPLLLSWTVTGREIAASSNLSVASAAGRLAVIDMAAWFLPLILLAYAARPLGFGDRFVTFFVANNWASAIITYLASPFDVLMLLMPSADGPILLVSLLILGTLIVFFVRLIQLTLAQSFAVTLAIFLFLLVSGFLIAGGLESAFGLVYPPAAAG
jgi:hypothetical protein